MVTEPFLVSKVTPGKLILVSGPARSGKSEWAESLATLAEQSGLSVVYVATAQMDASDPEWQARIQQHQARRSSTWQTQLVPIELEQAILAATATQCLLIDSLGTWLANVLEQDEATWKTTMQGLLDSLQATQSRVILVAEETGWGVVPAYPIGRKFRDRLGTLVQKIGAIAEPVYLVVAGYAINLRTLGTPIQPENSFEGGG